MFILKCKRKYFTYRVKKYSKECGENLTVNYSTIVTPNTKIGHHCNFNGMLIKGTGEVTIGNYFHSGRGCWLISSYHDYDHDDAIPYGRNNVITKTTIDDFVWLGDHVTIIGGCHIGEGAVIQAGSVVVHDIPPYAVAGGHPCEVFKYRDIDHFLKLKSEGKFF